MNTTEYFKRTIQAYLEERAMEDELFAAKYDNPDKNIDDCVTYILNWVQKSGCNGFCDDEIYGQAIHYYEEKDIEVGKPLNCQVSVNHHIELTEEEKAQARQEAIRQYQQEQMNKMRNRDTAKHLSCIVIGQHRLQSLTRQVLLKCHFCQSHVLDYFCQLFCQLFEGCTFHCYYFHSNSI